MNNATCLSVGVVKEFVVAYSVLPFVAIISYTLTIAAIVKTKAYLEFVHRLILYLAITGTIRTITFWIQLLPVDILQPDSNLVTVRKGWEWVCAFGGFLSQYSAFAETSVVFWIYLHTFVYVVFQKQLRRTWKGEALALLIVTFGPHLFTWEPFITSSYGLSGATCWIKEDVCEDPDKARINLIVALTTNSIPLTLIWLLGVVLVLAAIGVLCRRYSRGLLKHSHWLDIRNALLLAVYPSLYSAVGIGRIIADVADSTHQLVYVITDVVSVGLYNVITVTIPLSLVLQHGFCRERRKLRRRTRLDAAESSENPYSEIEPPEVDSGIGECASILTAPNSLRTYSAN